MNSSLHHWRRRLAGFDRKVVRSLVALTFPAAAAEAQSGSTTDGALFLLLPVGARAVGMGQAMVAEQPGSEAVWWNPSAIARQKKKEIGIHHSQTLAATGDAITVLYPTADVGALALSVNVLNFGDQQITDPGGVPIGVVLPRNILFAATYGAALGKRINAGVTYKRLQYRVDCSGQCTNVSTFTATSSAVDFGMQYDVPSDSQLMVGAAVRNVGTRLQVNDSEQADPLPTRIEVGAEYKVPFITALVADTELRIAAAVVSDKDIDHPAARIGADLAYEKNIHLRGGYVANDANGARTALGFGVVAGRLMFDIARTFGGLSSDAGQTPTYLSLRYLF
ncbi:MAG: PorV/PorQ family protein [Gemmatimonadota bacterium]|nr:PorV/PorQ family protein [Gemmatimonadota bacterium]